MAAKFLIKNKRKQEALKMEKFPEITIDSLPNEIMLMIFDRVAYNDLLNCSLVSKTWFAFIEQSNRLLLSMPRYFLATWTGAPTPLLHRSYQRLRISYLAEDASIPNSLYLQAILAECRYLIVEYIESPKALANFMKRLKNLQSLNLRKSRFTFNYFSTTEKIDLSVVLEEKPLLRELSLTDIEDIELKTLPQMTCMRKLRLENVPISDSSLQNLLDSTPNLEQLELRKVSSLTTGVFSFGDGLGALTRLHTLAVPANVVTDVVVAKMRLPRLRKLCFFMQRDLQASKTAITDTLAKNCPILKVIHGSDDTVRYERNAATTKFQQVFYCNETVSSMDSESEAMSESECTEDENRKRWFLEDSSYYEEDTSRESFDDEQDSDEDSDVDVEIHVETNKNNSVDAKQLNDAVKQHVSGFAVEGDENVIEEVIYISDDSDL